MSEMENEVDVPTVPSSNDTNAEKFEFEYVRDLALPAFTKLNKERWFKWGLSSAMQISRFSLVGVRWRKNSCIDSFFSDFFNSLVVREHFLDRALGPRCLDRQIKCSSVDYYECSTAACTLGLLNRLREPPYEVITRGKPGYIKRMFDEDYEGLTIFDELRSAMINPDSENYYVYTSEERQEILIQLFTWIITGGSMCQFEDTWDPYLAALKDVMRDLLTVTRTSPLSQLMDAEGKEMTLKPSIAVQTKVFRVQGITDSSGIYHSLFQSDSPHNYCWIFVDGIKRSATVLYSPFTKFW